MTSAQAPDPGTLRELFTRMRDPGWADKMIAAMSATARAEPPWPWRKTFLAAVSAAVKDGEGGHTLLAQMRQEAADARAAAAVEIIPDARAQLRAVVDGAAARSTGWDAEPNTGETAA